MKYLKKIDFMGIGIYFTAIIFSLQSPRPLTYGLIVCALHYFPLMYLLRKHGYLDIKDELGLNQTDKMEIMIQDLVIDPVKNFLAKKKLITTLIQILLLSFVIFVISYLLFPVIAELPFLNEICLRHN